MLSLTQKLCGVPPARLSILNNRDQRSLDRPHDFHEKAPQPDKPTPPIHRLPVELFAEIFKHYLDDTHPDSFTARVSSLKSTTFARFNPIVLGHVCGYWRTITLSIPTLWSSIAIFKPTSSQIPMIQLWIERAADCPLSITIHQGNDVNGVASPPKATQDILLLFLARVYQWRRIEFYFHDKALYTPFLNLSPSDFAVLEDVDVDIGDWNYSLADRVWQTFHSSPSLRRVWWDMYYLENGIPTHAPLVRLTHIKMGRVPGLTLSAHLEMLRQCQALRFLECKIVVPWGNDVSFEAEPVVLPHLRGWKIAAEGSGDPGPFLSHITLPSLVSLDIDLHFCSESPIRLVPYLQDLLIRSACSLEDLSLRAFKLTEAELIMALELPQVQTVRRLDLSFVWHMTMDHALTVLAQCQDGCTRILPHLKALILPGCHLSGDAVSAVVTARSPQLESIHMACECITSRPRTHDLSYLRSLQSAGHDFQFGIVGENE